MWGREKHTFNSGNPLALIMVLPSPILKLNGTACRISKGLYTLAVKVWVTPPVKNPSSLRCPRRKRPGKGFWKEESYK